MQLIHKEQLGDTHFGAPPDVELLNEPWGFYRYLKLDKTATKEEIKKRYRQMAVKLHPDRRGNEEKFKQLELVANTLLDDGQPLGPEYSLKRQYDTTCALDEFFDGFVDWKGERTRKLSEIILIQMQLELKSKKWFQGMTEEAPELAELEQELKSTTSEKKAKSLVKKINATISEVMGVDEKQAAKLEEAQRAQMDRVVAKAREFMSDLRENLSDYQKKILDIYYVGNGRVTFGGMTHALRLPIMSHNNRTHILELILADEPYISGFSKVHFKSKQADVRIDDPNVTGIFHMVKGSVVAQYDWAPSGMVIRARGSEVSAPGFEKRGDLFVPKQYATQNWWNRKPALDIAVHDGTVSMTVRSSMANLGYGNPYSLSNIIQSGGYESIIPDKYISNTKKNHYY